MALYDSMEAYLQRERSMHTLTTRLSSLNQNTHTHTHSPHSPMLGAHKGSSLSIPQAHKLQWKPLQQSGSKASFKQAHITMNKHKL